MTDPGKRAIFAQDTYATLLAMIPLVNSEFGGPDVLADVGALSSYLDEHQWTGRRDGDEAELAGMRELRARTKLIWELAHDEKALVAEVNNLLTATEANPWLTHHPEAPYWHLHFTRTDAPLTQRVGAEIAMSFADVVRAGELGRLKRCAAPDCSAVLMDFSRNRSRRFCDIGNCGNKLHVAAYRARRRSVGESA